MKLSDDIIKMKDTFSNVNKIWFMINLKTIYVFSWFKVIKGPLKRLELNRAMYAKDIDSLSKFYVLQQRELFRKKQQPGIDVTNFIT